MEETSSESPEEERMIASRRGNASPGARSHIRAERDQTMFLICLLFVKADRYLFIVSLESPNKYLDLKRQIFKVEMSALCVCDRLNNN